MKNGRARTPRRTHRAAARRAPAPADCHSVSRRLGQLDPAVLRQHVPGRQLVAQLGRRRRPFFGGRQEHAVPVDGQRLLVGDLHGHLPCACSGMPDAAEPEREVRISAAAVAPVVRRALDRWRLPGVHEGHRLGSGVVGPASPSTLSDPDIGASGVAYVEASRRSSTYRSTRVAGACGPTTTHPRISRRENSSTIPTTGTGGGGGATPARSDPPRLWPGSGGTDATFMRSGLGCGTWGRGQGRVSPGSAHLVLGAVERQADAGEPAARRTHEEDAEADQAQHQGEDSRDGLATVVAGGAEVEEERPPGTRTHPAAATAARTAVLRVLTARSRPAHGPLTAEPARSCR